MKLTPKTMMMGLATYFAAASGGYLYLRSTKAPTPAPCGCGSSRHGDDGGDGEGKGEGGEEGGGQAFDRLADRYDSCINIDETVMGIKLMRRWLVQQAEGDVLEVSAGTGRNLKYYPPPPRLRSLTLTDTSRPMLVNAADKYAAARSRSSSSGGSAAAAVVRFELADAQHLTSAACVTRSSSSSSGGSSSSRGDEAGSGGGGGGPKPAAAWQRPPLREQRTFAPHSFDVVVDTFGLCSQADPVTALREMARVCRPGGRILLLQHGKGTWDFVNRILDNGADQHLLKWGCRWNRDIEQLVRQAGLQVETCSRWHFGTTYMIVARPPPPPPPPEAMAG